MTSKFPRGTPKRILAGILLLAGSLVSSSCYLTSQGLTYLAIIAQARPAKKLLALPETGPETRRLLETALQAREYAIRKIGLKNTKNYTSLAMVRNDHLANIVQACAPLAFDRYLWNYPFTGPLPYRGYFEKSEAEREAERLKRQGYDTIIRPADAFSTLGFLADPLFSFMTSYSDYEIAELVIHEMTHATIFLRGKDTGSFNEELATFVGRKGAFEYMKDRYGMHSDEYRSAVLSERASITFSKYIRETAGLLETLYRSGRPESEMRTEKERIIAERATLYAHLAPTLFAGMKDSGYQKYPMHKINNALLDLYLLYDGEPEAWENFYHEEAGEDLAAFIKTLSVSKNPRAIIARYRKP